MADTICEGDVGTNLDFTVKEGGSAVDLTGASVNYVFRMFDGTIKTKTGAIQDAANGVTRYTLVSGDIDQVGRITVQLELTIGTWVGCSSHVNIEVIDKLSTT